MACDRKAILGIHLKDGECRGTFISLVAVQGKRCDLQVISKEKGGFPKTEFVLFSESPPSF